MIDVRTVADRRLRSLFEHWHHMSEAGRLPGRRDLDPLEIPWALGHLLILELDHDDPVDSRFRLFGSRLVDHFRRDLTMKTVGDAEIPSEILRLVQAVTDLREPVQHFGPALFGPSCLTYEYVFLPLSRDGTTIDMILSGAAPTSPGC